MYDGYAKYSPPEQPRYRFEMQASTGHWVSYRILEWNGAAHSFVKLTDWKVIDVDTGDWDPAPQWLTDSEGIFIGPTDGSAGPWKIKINNVQCGWF